MSNGIVLNTGGNPEFAREVHQTFSEILSSGVDNATKVEAFRALSAILTSAQHGQGSISNCSVSQPVSHHYGDAPDEEEQ